MKIRLLLLFAVLTLQSCMSGSGETVANEKIDSKLRNIIKAKNDSLLHAMSYSDLKIYKALGSDDFVKHLQAKTRNVVWLYRKGYLDNQYTIFDEYYSNNSKRLTQVKIPSEEKGYTFSYVNDEKETYVSLLTTSLYQNDYLLVVIYGLTDKGWKINDIEVSMFGHYKKNAKQYYDIAKQYEEKGFLIDAFQNADLSLISIREAESMLKFDDEKSIELYRTKLAYNINKKYKFPLPLEDIKTRPEILGIEYVLTKEGMFPVINYKTLLPLNDIVKLEDEYKLLKEKAKGIYTDLNFNKKAIEYRACSTLPDEKGGTYIKTHEFIDKKEK